jgi:predicted RNase H-like HicB family nuclease
MKIKIVVHDAEEGGYWAEVPAILGCVSQGETTEYECVKTLLIEYCEFEREIVGCGSN